ncbi:MAG: leucyl/phenylalanyl-tRNA--protein transferase [Alphaproteobacteria bacterium]|nr:leucyl/phenylalanyl-tRNA--protein transferase [Alphaproteobacteria bacterium]
MLELTPDMLLRAYAIGVFPMAEDRDDPELFWVDPRLRGIIPLDDFHIPRRLQRTIRSGRFHVTFDHAFEEVIESCAEATEVRPRTWINDRIVTLYTSLFHMRHAHSVECWHDGELAGGLYGVSLGGAFFGESMFSRKRDASKVALVHLVARLRRCGFVLLDAQFTTDHLNQFGAREIPRKDYRIQLADALKADASFDPEADGEDPGRLLETLGFRRELP